ncbi:MAG TPA: CRISPR system precrRNA processing endoribonuclease RAMP protein Cas6 [Thermoanaerobaculia bacterium]|nr:CRISPR system precrRNA processing endoribonuclease RAMP protein Cas6 [Thermoanaerobaculia bacterium]
MPPTSAVPYKLPAIPYLRLRHTLRATAPALLPPYKGSLLRGAFGHALRRTVCTMGPTQACESCRLRQACVYTRIFETFIEGHSPPLMAGLPTAPRPYVFEPQGEEQRYAPGDPLEFDLLLFGQAIDLNAYAQLAVERMAATGLGKDRHPFALDRIQALLPDGTWRIVLAGGAVADSTALPPSLPDLDGPGDRQATNAILRFLTPTRLKAQSQSPIGISFRGLAFAMIRRTLEIAHFHVPGAAIDWTFRPLLDLASAIRIASTDLVWRDWDRYSNRQGTKMTFGGFVGTLHLEGDLAGFVPLLRTAEILHLGKGATFGQGRIQIEASGPVALRVRVP